MLREAVFAFLVALAVTAPFDKDLDRHWNLFKEVYHKHYQIYEEAFRRLIFEQNVKMINDHNLEYQLGRKSYRVGLNPFADLTLQEFVKEMNGLIPHANKTSVAADFQPFPGDELPDTFDCKKIVTPVKDQGNCHASWAFSATGALEGHWAKAHGVLVSLSAQEIIDCSKIQGNHGCEGGRMDYAFNYIIANNGIDNDTESCYPYTGKDGPCRRKEDCVSANMTGYVNTPSGDEDVLKQAVANECPVSVAIDASNWSFRYYEGGIYNEPRCRSTALNFGVLIVGYGTENGKDYWLVKNSWGIRWGEHGYIRMSRNKDNQCGIATMASYPTL